MAVIEKAMISRLALGIVRTNRPGLRVLGYALQSGGGGVSSLNVRQYPSMQWYHSTGHVRDSGNAVVSECEKGCLGLGLSFFPYFTCL